MYDYATPYLGSFLTYGGGAIVLLFVVLGLVYLSMIFFAGLMAYYFTGAKPGAHILHSFMRVGARAYAHLGVFVGILIGWFGLGMLLRGVLGSMIPGFVYFSSTSAGPDFQMGLVLSMFALIVVAAHWAMAYVIETPVERKGTFVSKIFVVLGIVISGILFFTNLLVLLLEVLAYVQNHYGKAYVFPGASLATLVATLPVAAYFMLRGWMMIKHEEGVKTKFKLKA